MSFQLTTIDEINDLLRGSIDMHLHFGPDPMVPRRVDAVSAALDAQQAGMRAIVLKSHSYPTAAVAHAAEALAPDVSVIGSLCLDAEIGGLNVHAIEASARIGAKVVWLPTFTATNSIRMVAASIGIKIDGNGISMIDGDGRLLPEAVACIEVIHEHDMVLATGHTSPAEQFAVMDECERIGHDKVVITHALEANVYEVPLSFDQIIELSARGAYIEHCVLSCLPAQKFHIAPADMVDAIRRIGPQRCVLGTDLGVSWNPPPAEGMRIFISMLLRHGLSEKDIRQMAHENPARLLGLNTNLPDPPHGRTDVTWESKL